MSTLTDYPALPKPIVRNKHGKIIKSTFRNGVVSFGEPLDECTVSFEIKDTEMKKRKPTKKRGY